MKNIHYTFVVGGLMYAQVCNRLDFAYVLGIPSRYQNNSGLEHWKTTKKVMRCLQGTKDYKLTYRHSNNLELIGYLDSDFAGSVDTRKTISNP